MPSNAFVQLVPAPVTTLDPLATDARPDANAAGVTIVHGAFARGAISFLVPTFRTRTRNGLTLSLPTITNTSSPTYSAAPAKRLAASLFELISVVTVLSLLPADVTVIVLPSTVLRVPSW